MNTIALRDDSLPPEGLFDTAVTNGLLAIVSHDSPGSELDKRGFTLPAKALLQLAAESPTIQLSAIDVASLTNGLDLTQPSRHGRADDEFSVVRPDHLASLKDLDQHPALTFLDIAKGKSFNECVLITFAEAAEERLLPGPKDRLMVPDPEECDECWRPTFLPSDWDAFGGTSSPGYCVACGHERTDDAAYEAAVSEAIFRAVSRND